jgi:hypothetical protein
LNASTEEGIANNNVTIVEMLLKCILSFDKAWRKKSLLEAAGLWDGAGACLDALASSRAFILKYTHHVVPVSHHITIDPRRN